jgi:hypothetical protein
VVLYNGTKDRFEKWFDEGRKPNVSTIGFAAKIELFLPKTILLPLNGKIATYINSVQTTNLRLQGQN